MHISDGVLSAPVLLTGTAAALVGVGVGLRRLHQEDIPRAAVMSSAFFVASLIHVPVGPTSAHLVLNGLTGLLLGWAAFPAILTAQVLQCLLFGFGGFTVLGVNTLTMALPAVLCHYIFRSMTLRWGRRTAFLAGFTAGAAAIGGAGLLVAVALLASGREFRVVAAAVLGAHLPVMAIEGFVTGAATIFLRRVRPELLGESFPGTVEHGQALPAVARGGESHA